MWLWNSSYRLALDELMNKPQLMNKPDNARTQMDFLNRQVGISVISRSDTPDHSISVLKFCF